MGNLRTAALVIAAAWALAGAAWAAPKVGMPAPAFTVTTYGGQTVKLADLKGDVIILNFWATWCGPCKKELPLLESAFKAYSQYGFQVLAVATEDSLPESKLRPIAAKMRIPFVHHLQGPYRDMGALPTNYVIDRSGKLVYAKAGAFDLDSLNAIVVPLLKEAFPEDARPLAISTPAPAATHTPATAPPAD
jgi:peroxiredoxin